MHVRRRRAISTHTATGISSPRTRIKSIPVGSSSTRAGIRGAWSLASRCVVWLHERISSPCTLPHRSRAGRTCSRVVGRARCLLRRPQRFGVWFGVLRKPRAASRELVRARNLGARRQSGNSSSPESPAWRIVRVSNHLCRPHLLRSPLSREADQCGARHATT